MSGRPQHYCHRPGGGVKRDGFQVGPNKPLDLPNANPKPLRRRALADNLAANLRDHNKSFAPFGGRMRPKISGRKIPFPKMVFALTSFRPTAGRHRRRSINSASLLPSRGAAAGRVGRRHPASRHSSRSGTLASSRQRRPRRRRLQIAHSFHTGTGRYDPSGKSSANDRYFSIPAVLLRRGKPQASQLRARVRPSTGRAMGPLQLVRQLSEKCRLDPELLDGFAVDRR